MESQIFHVKLETERPGRMVQKKFEKVKSEILKSSYHLHDYPTFVSPPCFKSVNEIAEPFCLIIFLLKVFGNSPISYETIICTKSGQNFSPKRGGQKRLRFFINWRAPLTIVSGILGTLSVSMWSLFFINFGMDTPFLISGIISHTEFDAILKEEESSFSPLKSMVRKTYLLTSSIMIIETVSRWRQAGKFIQFLSRWEGFERLIVENFPHYDYSYDFSTLTRFRDTLILFYVTYPSMILIPAFLTVYASRLEFMAKLLAVAICSGFIGVSLLEDVKVILSYKAIQQAFYQVRLLVTHHSQQNQKMNGEKAYAWRKLVQYIRNQAELAGRFQKFEELTRMAGYIGLVTLFIFIILNGWQHAKERGDMLFVLSFCGYSCMLMIRMYFKAVVAEDITHEEYRLAKVILEMDSRSWDSRTVLEMKTLVDCIALKPARICFGNYVVLNKRLLLGISSQVVSYLIVLMQFSQPNNG